MNSYSSLREKQLFTIKKLQKQINILSFFRFLTILLALIAGYYFYETSNNSFIYSAFGFGIAFLVLLRMYDAKSNIKNHKEAIVAINEEEVAYLNQEKIPFDDGLEFNAVYHEYAYDLDFFGNKSVFQNLNRTYTFIGKKTLATTLLSQLSNQEITENQEAIKELAAKIEWRQNFMGYAKISNDKPDFYEKLIAWSKSNTEKLPVFVIILSYLLPIIFITLFISHILTEDNFFFKYVVLSFVLNLVFAFAYFKRIKQENAQSTAVDKIVKQYSLMINCIEQETFQAVKLLRLQKELHVNGKKASTSLCQLSRLFSISDSVANPVAAILLNGSVLYHFHNLKAIIHWKIKYAKRLEQWLAIIGEFEMLNSLANFSYNNPDFAFPEINEHYEVSFTEMSHPLLKAKDRVANTVNFQPQSFIILTGSNMSGKSTFLRSLGVNMVLAGIGSVVCAAKANIHPMPILVSMRLSDSLADSESYFYAEIKRLKQIMDALENKRSFVLLDEILRGTNSDDKRSGTVAVIQKMIAQNAMGAIATHDIEVCLITNDNPKQLINKCFEAEINNDDLHFDYKLRDGICKNKSATFLMQKIGVI